MTFLDRPGVIMIGRMFPAWSQDTGGLGNNLCEARITFYVAYPCFSLIFNAGSSLQLSSEQ